MIALPELRAALAGDNELASFVWNQSREGWAFVSPDGTMELVNPAFAKMLGYARSELQGRRFQDITAPNDLEGDMSEFERLLKGEIREYEFVKTYRGKSGNVTCRLRAIDFDHGVLICGNILPVDVLSLEHLPEAEKKRVLAMMIGAWCVTHWKLFLTILFALVGAMRIDDVARFVSGQ